MAYLMVNCGRSARRIESGWRLPWRRLWSGKDEAQPSRGQGGPPPRGAHKECCLLGHRNAVRCSITLVTTDDTYPIGAARGRAATGWGMDAVVCWWVGRR